MRAGRSRARTGRRTRERAHTHAGRALPLRHAVALGLLHGPTELLPVSSSAHTTLVSWLAGWPYAELAAPQRKSFEVALHAGTAVALLVRAPVSERRAPPAFLLPAIAPAALTGYALGEQIERRAGTPGTIAAGLLAGSAAMLCGELHARGGTPRAAAEAGARDGFALGIAQALALIPGVSRSGASLAAARARGFSRSEADRLSWASGLPVIAGAALLRGTQLARTGAPPQMRASLIAGGGASLLSTLLSARLLSAQRRAALLPACTAYRGALALLTIRRMRDNTS